MVTGESGKTISKLVLSKSNSKSKHISLIL